MEQKQIKTGFFKKVWRSITKIEKYPEMAAEGLGRAISYLLKIVAILALVLCLGTVFQIHTQVRKGIDYLQNEFPELAYKEGILQVDSQEEIIISEENSTLGKVIINTNDIEESQANKYVNTIEEEGSGVVVLKENIIVKNSAISGTIGYSYKDIAQSLGITEFNKESIINYANSTKIISVYLSIFAVLFIYAFVMYSISKLIDVLLLSLFGHITTLLARIKMRYVGVFNMAVYAMTLSLIFDILYIGINIFVPFTIKYFQVMYVGVAAIYIVAAILILKTDIREQQIELKKIIEVQREVKEQLDEEKNEKRKEEEKKERQKKDKEENEGTDDVPDTPEGSNA